MTAVSSRQDASIGGFTHQSGQNVLIDTERSSAAAMGCIWAMYLDKASQVARFLAYALDHQPKPGCFFTYFDTDGRAFPDLNDRNAYFALDDAHARPAVFACSIASLVWLGRATGETRYFDLAHRYMRWVFSHTQDAALMPLATKTGWAALMLRCHVADDALTAFAQRSGDDLVARVQADGSIDFNGVPDVPKPIDKVWLIGWSSDVALTLLALADGTA